MKLFNKKLSIETQVPNEHCKEKENLKQTLYQSVWPVWYSQVLDNINKLKDWNRKRCSQKLRNHIIDWSKFVYIEYYILWYPSFYMQAVRNKINNFKL
ncbi:unnamed protein product [Arctia plantaginis]|uniref:Uncharacterized protein n=1 Tax=Arctia plantaginis TaxID=874455 RepID=A0A8S0ZQW6_ARCPL|nr:unnamed protein product [Arctia plantaginis]CAB3250485.1 unnamed protein product [Arctia plantaginis]